MKIRRERRMERQNLYVCCLFFLWVLSFRRVWIAERLREREERCFVDIRNESD